MIEIQDDRPLKGKPVNKLDQFYMEGKVKFLFFEFRGNDVCGFFERHAKIDEKNFKILVSKFLESKPELSEAGSHMVVENYEEIIDGKPVFFLFTKNPETKKPTIFCGNKKILKEAGIIKAEVISDGQQRFDNQKSR